MKIVFWTKNNIYFVVRGFEIEKTNYLIEIIVALTERRSHSAGRGLGYC